MFFLRRLLGIGAVLFVFSMLSACGSGGDDAEGQACQSLADCPEGLRCTDQGRCSSQNQACTNAQDCGFDEYCDAGFCAPALCETDDQCSQGNVCVNHACRPGCRPDAGDCPQGTSCNELTLICEQAGCTPTSCRARIQRCDQDLDPPACVFTGVCDSDVHCISYRRQIESEDEYVCDTAQSECVIKPPCASDDDCRVGDICEERDNQPNRCRPGCRSTSDCSTGQICAHDQGSVCTSGCASDDDCLTMVDDDSSDYFCRELQCIATCNTVDDCRIVGQICAGTPRHCQDCLSDTDCRTTQFCDMTKGSTLDSQTDPERGLCVDMPPECPDDDYGNNHGRDSAYAIDALPFQAVTSDVEDDDKRPYFCRENMGGDWFSFEAQSGDIIEVELEYDNTAGNLDLALLRADGQEIVASARPPTVDGGKEFLSYGVDLGSTFLVQVRGTIVRSNIRYSLNIHAQPAPQCPADSMDPNTQSEPAPIDEATPYQSLYVCGDQGDYYQISAKANQSLRITAQAPRNLGGVRLLLYNDSHQQLARTEEFADTQTLYYETFQSQTLILEVLVANGVGNVEYSLEWTQQDNICADVFEPNSSCDDAALITAGVHEDLAMCAEPDYYLIELFPLQTLTVSAFYDPSQSAGELDIALFGPNDCLRLIKSGVEHPVADSNEVVESLTYQATQGGDFYLLGNLFQGLHVPYRLEIDIEDGPACVDDWAAPNADASQAYTITPEGVIDATQSALLGLRVCDNKEDWFKLALADGDEIEWQVLYDASDASLEALLIAPDGETVLASSSSSSEGKELVSYTVEAGKAGDYYLKVRGAYPVRTTYRVITYLNGVGPANPLCPDRFGPNDSREEAAEIVPGAYENLMVCGQPRSDDWFKTWVKAGETIKVDLNFSHADGRIDLHFFDDSESSQAVAMSASSDDNESITYVSARDQYVYYRVHTQTFVDSNVYDLGVTVTPAPACPGDQFTGNHDIGEATEVEAPGLYTRLLKCENQDDWFQVELTEGTGFEAFVRFDGNLADLDLHVHGPDASAANPQASSPILIASSDSITSNESVEFIPEVSGTYYLQITEKSAARLAYDLLLYSDTNGDGQLDGPADRVCPDQFQNNDTRATAHPIAPGHYEDLLMCWGAPTDPDYFSIFVPAGATLHVDLYFSHDEGDIQLRVYRGTSVSVVAQSISNTDNESVSVTNEGLGETYIIHVYGAQGTFRNYYAMDVGLSFVGTCTDTTQAGLTQAQAKTLNTGAYSDLSLCEGSEHWYMFNLSSGNKIHVEMELNNRFGNIDLELHNSQGDVVASNYDASNLKGIETNVTSTGTYYLRVYPKGGAFIRTSYDLWVSRAGQSPSVPYCPDAYERNDSPLMAYPLNFSTQSQYVDMIACGVEEDWYQVSLIGNTNYDFNVFYNHSNQLKLALEVQDAQGNVVKDLDGTDIAFSTANNSNDALTTFRAPASGTYFIGVKNSGSTTAQNNYAFYFNRSNALCPEDAYHPNNTIATAKELSVPGMYALGSCRSFSSNSEDDYFKLVAAKSGTISIEVFFDSESLELIGAVESFSPNMNASVPNRLTYSQSVTAGQELIVYIGNSNGQGPYFMRIQH